MLTSATLALLALGGLQGSPVKHQHHRDSSPESQQLGGIELPSIGFPPGLPFPPSLPRLGKSDSSPLESKIQDLVKKVDQTQAKKSTEYFPKVVYASLFRAT
jgi:hypothetical protein